MLAELFIASGALYAGAKKRAGQLRKKQASLYLGRKTNDNRLASFLGVDARRQHLQDITALEPQLEAKEEAQLLNRNLAIAATSFSLATVGGLGFPILSLLSVPGFFFVTSYAAGDAYETTFKERRLSVDLLVLLAAVPLLLTGHLFLCNLTAISRILSLKLRQSAQDNLRANLIDALPQPPHDVWVQTNQVEVQRPIEAVYAGDIVVVYAGDTIPADGRVVDGDAAIDERLLTGETQPVEKTLGDAVYALTTVLSGRLHIAVDNIGTQTAVAQLSQILQQSADVDSQAMFRFESITDKTVLPTLLISCAALPTIGSLGASAFLFAHPYYKANIAGGITSLNFLNLVSRKGILIKDGRTFDLLKQVDTVVFDKAGILTEEQPTIGRIHAWPGHQEHAVLRYAAALEAGQTHAVAQAIQREAVQQGIDVPEVDSAESMTGYGTSAVFDGFMIRVGSIRFMDLEGLAIDEPLRQVQSHSDRQGHSLMWVAVDDKVIGAIELCPVVRAEAKAVIEALRENGITATYMISRDHDIPTKKLAFELGIDHYFAQTLPEQKADIIETLQASGKSVCYVSDGIHNAIALQKAMVSVSLGGAATLAADAAQVLLMDRSLRRLGDLLTISKSYETHMKTSVGAVFVPHLMAMGGVLFFHVGFITTFILAWSGFLAGAGCAMWPLIRDKTNTLLEPAPSRSPEP